MYQQLIDDKMDNFEKAVLHFEDEARKLRTGRAQPSLVEEIMVDYYDTPTPLKQISNISIPEPRQILVQPWDKELLKKVEEAIKKADIGVTPSTEGDVLRITLPPVTEENRKDTVKVLNSHAEAARVSIRTTRDDVWKAIQAEEKQGGMSEDDKFAGKDALQKVVDQYNTKIEDLRKKKEGEIMTV